MGRQPRPDDRAEAITASALVDASPVPADVSPAPGDAPAAAPVAATHPRGPFDPERERAALALLAQGDRRGALIAIMTLYGAPIYAYCRRVLRDEVLAQDAQQVVFVQVYRDLGSFRGEASLWSWIRQIAHHRCMDAVVRRRREQQRTVSLDGDEPWDAAHTETEVPTLASERTRRQRALERCLGRLSEPVRATVLMKYQLGLTFDEMSASLGERAGTLQVRVSRALPLLRRCLERAGITL